MRYISLLKKCRRHTLELLTCPYCRRRKFTSIYKKVRPEDKILVEILYKKRFVKKF